MAWPVERKHPRVNVTLQAELRSTTENFPRRAQTTDISAGGGYFEMVSTVEPKNHLDITLWLGDVKIKAWAEVVTNDPHVGNGVKFVRMTEKDRAALKEFVEKMQNSSSSIERAMRRGTLRNTLP